MCKPHKHGWAPKKKAGIVAMEKQMDREIAKILADSDNRERAR